MASSQTLLNIIKLTLILAFGYLLILYLFSKIFFRGCGYETQLNIYKSLPEQRLEQLFSQFQMLKNQNRLKLRKKEVDDFSPVLSDLDFKYIDIDREVMLIGGCVDDKLFLHIDGLDTDKKEQPKIHISWGEYPLMKEVLWLKTNNLKQEEI